MKACCGYNSHPTPGLLLRIAHPDGIHRGNLGVNYSSTFQKNRSSHKIELRTSTFVSANSTIAWFPVTNIFHRRSQHMQQVTPVIISIMMAGRAYMANIWLDQLPAPNARSGQYILNKSALFMGR